jgi:hypothetical protein
LSSDYLVHERHLQCALRTINGNGWRQRLAPLAEYMGNRRMIRARSECGAALALLDLDTLQEALARLLRHNPRQAHLIIALAVENAPAEVVASQTGLDPSQQVAAVRAALSALALEYESVAFTRAVEEPGLGAALCAAVRTERRSHPSAAPPSHSPTAATGL